MENAWIHGKGEGAAKTLRGKVAKMTHKMEQKLEMRERSEIARRCWREIKERAMRNEKRLGWEEERIEFYSRRGIEIEEQEETDERILMSQKRILKDKRNAKREKNKGIAV